VRGPRKVDPHVAVCCAHACWYVEFLNFFPYFFDKQTNVGRLGPVNDYLSSIPIKTNDPTIDLMRIKCGVETLTMISAKQLPGVLLQVSEHMHYLVFFIVFLHENSTILLPRGLLHLGLTATKRRVSQPQEQNSFNVQLDSSLQS
jgi:hypothetical protein